MHMKDAWLPFAAFIVGWGLHAAFHLDKLTPEPKQRIFSVPMPAHATSMRLTRALADEISPLQQVISLDTLRRTLAQGQQPFSNLLAEADKLGGLHVRRSARLLILRAWAQQAPDEAWQHGIALNEPEPHPFLRDLVEVWSEFAPEEAAGALATLPRKSADFLLRRMLEPMARRDPTDALSLWKEIDPQANSHEISEAIFKELAKTNVLDALAEVDELPLTKRGIAEAAIVSEWAKHDPDATLDWLAGHPRVPIGLFDTTSTLANALLQKEPDEMLDTVSAIRNRELKSAVIDPLTRQWLATDFEAAIDYGLSPGADSDIRSKVAEESLRPLLRNGEVARAVSLMKFLPQKNNQEILTRTISTLLNSNPTPVSLDAAGRMAEFLTDESVRAETVNQIEEAKADACEPVFCTGGATPLDGIHSISNDSQHDHTA
ncbi:MAG: hypothetical protein KDN22_31010 [Verrucomicrobiae bacterium]|nr:hypothetical protein [Verrucomicrobiae bacterium]